MRHDVPHQLMPISHNQEETEMDATTVAVDLAKSVFELAIANTRWRVWSRQRLNRARFARFLAQTPPTHVVMEACGTAHYWGRVALCVSNSQFSRENPPHLCGVSPMWTT